MKKSMLVLSAVVATLFAAQAAVAQNTRAEVKAEAASAVKSGAVEKGPSPSPGKNAVSTKDRADVKKEAAAATVEKGPSPNVGKTTGTDKTRAEVKVEAAAAVKAGEVGKGPDVKK